MEHTQGLAAAAKIVQERRRASERLITAAPDLLSALQSAYAVLGDVFHQWPGRDSMDGQHLLSSMRDAISSATGRDPCEVSSDLRAEFVRAAIAKATGA